MQYRRQRVYVIRHGETEWSVSGQHTGITDVPLTPNGRAMARMLAHALREMEFEVVLSSPLRRALETCEIAGLGKRVVLEPDLVEWNYGVYEGRTPQQIRQQDPDWLLFRDGAPGGETPEQVGVRVDCVIARIRATEGDVAVFAHGHILRVFGARWLELDVSYGSRFRLDTSTISVLSYYHGIPAIERWNDRLAQ